MDDPDTFRRLLNRVPIFVVDNVAAYIHEQSQFTKADRFPLKAILPPFNAMWIEYTDPRRFRDGTPQYFGAILMTQKNGSGWKVDAVLYSGCRNMNNAVCLCHAPSELDAAGQLVDPEPVIEMYLSNGIPEEQLSRMIGEGFCPIYVALSFLHCKNVVRIEHVPDRALVKRSRERGNPLPLKYHTLEIEPMKQVLRTEGQIEKVGLERALHICRGHFAHYAEDGPGLFGKGLHGDFWIPQHVRGTEKRGVVISDYNVNAPKDGGLQMKEPDGA
jgi:hypothetical protein